MGTEARRWYELFMMGCRWRCTFGEKFEAGKEREARGVGIHKGIEIEEVVEEHQSRDEREITEHNHHEENVPIRTPAHRQS